jgi:hypothetical protein
MSGRRVNLPARFGDCSNNYSVLAKLICKQKYQSRVHVGALLGA